MREKKLQVASCEPAVSRVEPLRVNTEGHCARSFNWQLTTGNWQLPAAFTLVELMVSIVLVLVLMVGIGKIFKLTSDTVGGGMAISDMSRDDRAAQVTMQNDFAGAASDSPTFMICSERVSAFLTPQDKKSDADGDPMTVPDSSAAKTEANNTAYSAGGSDLSPALYGDRNHRVDRIGFFARGQFNRQTSNNNNSFAPVSGSAGASSTEAYIWYGHVRLPGTTNLAADFPDGNFPYQNGATVQFPHIGYKSNTAGQFDNDANYGYYENNPIATNWVLGRQAILLTDESNFNAGGVEHLIVTPNNLVPLSPLAYGSVPGYTAAGAATSATDYYPLPKANPNNGFNYRSRYDVAGTTISTYRDIVTAAYNLNQANAANPPWWWPLVYDTRHPNVASIGSPPVLPFRFECNPYITKPMTGTGMAQTTPYFIPHVTQFIVEFAGDYLTQTDPSPITAANSATAGQITDVAPDGKIDFYYDKSADTTSPPTNYPVWTRKIRWYGFPRDTGGSATGGPDGSIPSPPAAYSAAIDPNSYADVLPFADISRLSPLHSSPPNFEVEVPTPATSTNQDYTAIPNGLTANDHYYCIWRNSAPKLVRILMKIDDPNGRVGQGRWVEQVFAVQ